MIPLSERLRLIASLVPQGARVCDVGTDHGYLPAALYLDGRVHSVIATDIREKPLESAKKNLRRFGADGVSLRLCDGLSAVNAEEADTVIVAGMGGEVIAGILARCHFVRNPAVTLILQPMTSAEELRDFLAQGGFRIEQEPALTENGKLYSVILARYDGIGRASDPLYRYVGSVSAKTEAGCAYIQKQYRRCVLCAQQLEGRNDRRQQFFDCKNAADQIKRMLAEEKDGI